MPADYSSTARALALPISPVRSPTATHHNHQPSWIRRQSGLPASNPNNRESRSGFRTQIRRSYKTLEDYAAIIERRFPPWQIYLSAFIGVVSIVLAVLFLIYNERIFGWIEPYAMKWKHLRGGWIILWMMTFVTGFPPIIGYSSTLTIAGFVYGVGEGWLIVASATIIGSTLSFISSRYLFSSFVHRLVAHDTRFTALSLVLKHDGLKLLCMIRLCPLPYSISNGAISTFETVHPATYALATVLVSPKLLIHVFIGSRLAAIAKSGEKMSAGTKAVNWLSIIFGMVLGALTGWYIYKRTMARARALEEGEDHDAAAAAAVGGPRSVAKTVRRFWDEPNENDTAMLLEDDQIDFLDQPENGYRDESADQDVTALKLGLRDEEDAIGLDEQAPRR